MRKNLSSIAAGVVIFCFLFISVAHACSGVAHANLVMQQSSMNMGTGNDSPCGKEKRDVCQLVRDSILSLKPSLSGPQQSVLPLLQTETPVLLTSSPVASVVRAHPVFKLILSLSSVILRI
jgi:hypothetical protein